MLPSVIMQKINSAIKIASDWYQVPFERLAAHLWAESAWGEEGTNTRIQGSDGHGQGIAQIDDRYHPFASDPLCKDVLLQVCYEALFLRGLYKEADGNWDTASMMYNGDPNSPVVQAYGRKIKLFMDARPWEKLLAA
jgi:hypothetical protein